MMSNYFESFLTPRFLPFMIQFLGVILDPPPPLKSDIIYARSLSKNQHNQKNPLYFVKIWMLIFWPMHLPQLISSFWVNNTAENSGSELGDLGLQ